MHEEKIKLLLWSSKKHQLKTGTYVHVKKECVNRGKKKKTGAGGLPWYTMVKNLPCNAGDIVLILGHKAEIPHATQQLSLCVAIIEPMHSEAGLPELHSPCAHATINEPECHS